jgi:transposase
MASSLLLSLPDDFVVDQVSVFYDCVTTSVRSAAPSAVCPLCSQPATRIHSRYRRTVADVPCGGRQLVLSLIVRKFFCQNCTCPRRIFAERFPDVARPWDRMTPRFCAALETIGFATCCRGRSTFSHTSRLAHLSDNDASAAQSCVPICQQDGDQGGNR